MVCHVLLQGIFLTQGWNPSLLHCQAGSLPREPPGKPTPSPPTMLLFLPSFKKVLSHSNSPLQLLPVSFLPQILLQGLCVPLLCSLNPPPSQVPRSYCRVRGEWQSGSILLLIKPPSKRQLSLSMPGLGFLRACRTAKVIY